MPRTRERERGLRRLRFHLGIGGKETSSRGEERREESKRRCRVRFFPFPSVQPRGGAQAEREKGRGGRDVGGG